SIDSRELRFSRAMAFTIEEINNSTKLLPGVKLGYKIHDSCASVPMAVSHFATCACLSDKQQYPSFFRTIPSDQFQADALAKLVKHFGWTWIGAVRSDSDYGNNGMASFLNAAQKEGICVEYSESFYRTHPRSRIQRVADVIRRSTAVVVVAFAAPGDMKILLEELSSEPSPPRQWIGSEAWVTDPDILKFSFCAGAIGFGIPKSVIPGLREFLLDLSPTKVAASPLLTEFWEDAFNCKLGKSAVIDDSVCDGTEDIETLQSPYTDTSQLRITNMVYKAVYAIAHAIHNAVCQDTNSRTQCDKFSRIESKQVLMQLKKVNFSQNGYDVSFDANGDPVAKYELVNWQISESGSIEMVTVGHYDASLPVGQEFHMNKNISWMDGGTQVPASVCSDSCPPGTRKVLQKGKPICCYDCIPCPEGEISNATDSPDCFPCPKEFWPNAERDTCFPKPVEFLSFDEVLGIILAAFSVGGACLAIVTAVVFFRHRTSPIVRANNSELSFLLLFSLTLCFLCSLTFIGAPSDWSCMLRHTAFGITFVLCISCVLGKTIVVLMAFRATLPGIWITFIPAYVSSPGKFTVAVEIFAILASSFGLILIDARELRFSRAMVFAIEEINNSKGLLPGIKLGYQIHDSCGSVPLAMHSTFQLSNGLDPVFYKGDNCSQSGMVMGIVGESGSTPSISMSRIIGSFNIPQVSHFATCACLSDKQQYPSFFRTIPSDQFQANVLAKLVKYFGWTWIGAVRSDSDYGNNGMASFLNAAQKEGICVEYSESFHRTHPHSRIQRVADVIRRSTSVVVVAFVASGDMKILLKELSREPSPPRQWIGSESWVTNPDMLKFSFCAGVIGFGIQKSVIPGLREFLLDLSPTKVAASPVLTEFWEDSFNCKLRKLSDDSCDGTEDVETLQSPYTDTSQLRITNMVYKAVYAIAHAIHNAVCEDTNSVTQCDKLRRIESKQVLMQLKKVNFSQNGYDVSFDANGDPVAKYELVNWQISESGSIEMVTVGHYDASLPVGQEFHINKNLTWMDGGTQVPVSVCSDSCPPGTRKVLQKGKPICCYDCIPCPDGENQQCYSIDSRELRFSRAMAFTIEEINNSTKLLPGVKLGYQIHDSCASVPMAVRVAFQLSNGLDPVFYRGDNCSHSGMVMAIVAESGSTPSISMSRLLGSFNIPLVSHFATCACLSDKQQYPTFFRTIPSDQFQADALAKLVKYFGWTWIGAVRSDSDYGNNGMASFLNAAQKEGICVEYSESFYRTHPRSRIQREDAPYRMV
ncbi:Vomeronasal type-2 receptor 1, partial [Nibea albiflora]